MWSCNYLSATSCLRKPKYFSLTQSQDGRLIFLFERRLNHVLLNLAQSLPLESRKFYPVNKPQSWFLAVFTFFPITYVTRYKKNRWHSLSEPTYHGQISSRLSPKTLRFLDENCHWRNKTWLKFVPLYINVRSTVKKLHEFAFQFSIVSTQFRLPGEQ